MKTEPEKNDLLSDVLSEGEPADGQALSLEHTLALLRQRRRRRRAAGMALSLAAVGAFLWAANLWRGSRAANVSEVAMMPPVSLPNPDAVSLVPGTAIQMINDEELLALFPDR